MSKDTRDYKHRAQSRQARPTPGWVWLLAGFLLGAFSVGLLWLKLTPGGEQEWVGAAPRPAERDAEVREDQRPPPKPRFDFYTLLPSMEVVVPEEELVEPEPQRTTPAASSEQAQTRPVAYLLQVGSFRKPADADRLKAQLALLGFSSHIQRVEGGPGGTWHRVRTGPFQGAAELRTARERLEADGHRTLVIRAAR